MIGQFFVRLAAGAAIDCRKELVDSGISANHAPDGLSIAADETQVGKAAAIVEDLTGQQLIPGGSANMWKCASGNRLATEVLLAEGVEAVHVMKKAGIKP